MNSDKIFKFKKYKKLKKDITAGVVFVYNNKILLVHPCGEKWTKSFSYPKGRIDKEESIKEAAVREVFEEIGIKFDGDLLNNENLHRIIHSDGDRIKVDYYYLVYLDDNMFIKYFRGRVILPVKNLQKSEIDWAGFIPIDQTKHRIKGRLRKILDHIDEVELEEEF